MRSDTAFETSNLSEVDEISKRHLKIFEDLKIEDDFEEYPSYDEEFFKPLEFDKSLQKLIYNEADVMMSLKRLKDLVERKNRFNNALARAEQTIRYISGYLRDYDIEVRRKITKEFIEFTVRIHVYNGIVDKDEELRQIKESLKVMFPDADEDTIDEAAKRIVDSVMRNT